MYATSGLLTQFLADAADRAPYDRAVTDAQTELTYGALAKSADAIAETLSTLAVQPGDRVILAVPNSVVFCAAYWGILAAGAVAVPLNPGTKVEKLAFVLADCEPSAVIAHDDILEIVKQAQGQAELSMPILTSTGVMELIQSAQGFSDLRCPSVVDQDLATIIYTSGSTGKPKGVMLSHLNMTSAARSVAQYLGYRAEDHIFCAVPMTFDYGLHQLTMAALTGASVQAEPSFTQPFFALKQLAASQATVLPVVPTMVPLIAPIADRFDLSNVRLVSSTAAAFFPELIDDVQRMMPDAIVFSMYGLTECHRCTYLPPAELGRRKASVGIAIPNTEMWVVDGAGVQHRHSATGELVIRGSTVMKGYWKNPEATEKCLKPGPFQGEYVLYTGDTCRLDKDGYLFFVGRSDDILKIGGEKVAPSEVEAALIAHDKVQEVCVLGAPHPVHGQVCIAHAVFDGPPETLIAWCRTQLEAHAVPFKVMVYDALPRTPNGKVDRTILQNNFRPKTAAMQPVN
ncbi:MAG: class I adenylate-forming enzyme family protein [Pseudoruegeria sp.]